MMKGNIRHDWMVVWDGDRKNAEHLKDEAAAKRVIVRRREEYPNKHFEIVHETEDLGPVPNILLRGFFD